MRSVRFLTALLGVLLIFLVGCGSSHDSFLSISNSGQGGLTLRVAADPSSSRGIRGRFQPAVTQIRVTVFNFSLVSVGQETVPRTGTAVFNNLPAGNYLIRVEGLLTGGTVIGFFDRLITLNSDQTQLIPGLKISNAPPAPDIQATQNASPFFVFTNVPDSVDSGTPFSVTAQVFNGDGTPVTSAIGGVSLTSNTTPFSANPANQVTNASGVVTFQNLNYSATTSGTSELVVNASGVDSATSGTLQINAASNPGFLQFTSVPASVVAGATFSVTAQAFNGDGSTFSGTVNGVTLVASGETLATNPSPQNSDENGIVTFTGLSFSSGVEGQGTLTVNATNFNSATSNSIQISLDSFFEIVSVDGSGNESPSAGSSTGDISADGRFVAFASEGVLAANDSNGGTDVYVHDRQTDAVELVSISSAGGAANQSCTNPSISADGRFVAFSSRATSLISGDTGGNQADQIYVYDRDNDTLERVSVDGAGARSPFVCTVSRGDAISGDGRFVTFATSGNLLSLGADRQVFIRDRQAGTTTLVSADSGNTTANSTCGEQPAISESGQFVAFESFADNLVVDDNNTAFDIFVKNITTGSIERVSVDNSGAEGDAGSNGPSLSADGRYVCFFSSADNFSALPAGFIEIFLFDRDTDTIEMISVNDAGTAGRTGNGPRVSANGRFVTFASELDDPGQPDTNGTSDVFVRDRANGTTSLVSIPSGETTTGNAESGDPRISSDGSTIIFTSFVDLLPSDTNGQGDVYAVSNPALQSP